MDVVFLFDGSRSVTLRMLDQMKHYATAAIQGYNLSPSTTRVGLAIYGGAFKIAQSLTPYQNNLLSAMNNVNPVGGIRRMGMALDAVQNQMFDSSNSRDDKAGKVVVLFTTGPNNIAGSQMLQQAAQSMTSNAVEIAVVAIGNDVDLPQLESIVTQPSNLFHAISWYYLPNFIHNVLVLAVSKQGMLLFSHSPLFI